MERDLKGNILIIDICYHINYITAIDNELRSCIVDKLLRSIIRANHLSFMISEIDDHTILFFRDGPALSVPVILTQFEAILASFDSELNLLKHYLHTAHQPSANCVIHYGAPDNFSKKEILKLQGTYLTDTYNSLKSKTILYTKVLMTDKYIEVQAHEAIVKKGRVFELYSAGTSRNWLPQFGIFSKTA